MENTSRRQPWVRAALLCAVMYALIGILFPQPAGHVRAWRLAAWVASAIVYAAHLGYEHFRLRNPPRSLASHAAVAVAAGAFALAGAGMLRSLAAAGSIRPGWWLALVAWPAVTAVPAFCVALVAGAVLTRLPWSAGTVERLGPD